MACTSFDLPIVEPIAHRYIAKQGLCERVKVASGDFFADALPKADVITMGMILRDWCRDVGFARFERLPLTGPSSAAVAWK